MDDWKICLEQMKEYGSKEAVIQNLKDAGCTENVINCCIACIEAGQKKELLKCLEKQRNVLLNKVHKEEKHIDCLDYLVYQIRRIENKTD